MQECPASRVDGSGWKRLGLRDVHCVYAISGLESDICLCSLGLGLTIERLLRAQDPGNVGIPCLLSVCRGSCFV